MLCRLSQSELGLCSYVGTYRRRMAIHRKRSEPAGSVADPWGVDIEGACAEYVVARVKGVFWNALSDGDISALPDAGDLQIRHTPRLDGCLILRPKDSTEATFILVVGVAPEFRIVGQIRGSEARRDEFWQAPNNRPGAWFVPQSALSPIGGGR